MAPTPVSSLSLTAVICESMEIVIANHSHFFRLSLFFLPLTFSIVTISGQFFTVAHFLHKFPPILHIKPLIPHLIYFLIIYVLALCAIATITYSTYHRFIGTPINFFTSVKSLTSSFLPLASTTILIHFLLICIPLTFLLFVGSIVMLVQNLGFLIDYHSIYFTLFSASMGVTLLLIIIYFHLNWSLAFVIAVTESKWGLGPLIRSSNLMKGMRSISFALLYFGVYGLMPVLAFTESALPTVLVRSPFLYPAMLLLGSIYLMDLLLFSTAVNTVLYLYCNNGELANESVEELVTLNLHSDDDKVSCVVTVAAA